MKTSRSRFPRYKKCILSNFLLLSAWSVDGLSLIAVSSRRNDHLLLNRRGGSNFASSLLPSLRNGITKVNGRRSMLLSVSSVNSEIPQDDCDDMKVQRAGGTAKSAKKEGETPGIWPCMDELDRSIIKITLPCIANFAINPLIGAVDLFWVGRMGNALAIAGQAAANQVFNSAFFLLSYLPSVTATLVSKEHATGDKEGVQDAICQAIFVGFLFALMGTSLLLLKPDFVLGSVLAEGAPALEFARPYLMIRAFAFLPVLLSNIGFSAFRGILDTVTPLKISLISNLFNGAFDPVLMFRFGLGVPGAAIATLIAETISAFSFMYIMLKKNMIRWSKLFRVPSWSKLEPLIKGGFALQLRNFALNITFLAVTRITQSLDSTGVSAAAHSIAIQVFQIGGIVLFALSAVAQTLVPNALVEKVDPKTKKITGGPKDAKILTNRMMSWGFILGAALGLVQIASLPLIHKITPLVEVQKAARMPSYIASVLQIINGLVFIGEGVMIGCGNFLQLSLSTIVATTATVQALYILPKYYGLAGVWMSFGVFNVLRLAGVLIHQCWSGPLAPRKLAQLEATS